LNRVAVFVGLNANLPWFLVPWYAGTTLAAAALLGGTSPADLWSQIAGLFAAGWSPATFFERARTLVSREFAALMIGPTTGAALLGASAYVVARSVLVRRARRHVAGGSEPR
jgi:hypothetical protein